MLSAKQGRKTVFIVQGKSCKGSGAVEIVKETRKNALKSAKDFLGRGIPFVTVIADGRVYTAKEFALTIIKDEDGNAPRP